MRCYILFEYYKWVPKFFFQIFKFRIQPVLRFNFIKKMIGICIYNIYEGEATRLAELALIFIPIYNVALSDKVRTVTYLILHL